MTDDTWLETRPAALIAIRVGHNGIVHPTLMVPVQVDRHYRRWENKNTRLRYTTNPIRYPTMSVGDLHRDSRIGYLQDVVGISRRDSPSHREPSSDSFWIDVLSSRKRLCVSSRASLRPWNVLHPCPPTIPCGRSMTITQVHSCVLRRCRGYRWHVDTN